jgi:hypothetical protein
MNKTKITIMIRVPRDAPAEFSAAEVHIAMIRELSKQDANIIVLNHNGTSHVNIHKSQKIQGTIPTAGKATQ